MSKSAELFKRALQVSPGGVHSPVRAFGHVNGEPLFIESAAGSRITDADGRDYIDFCMAFGPLILGHAHADVAAAVHAAVDDGWSYGTAERWSLELAELINNEIPWAEQIRFVNSGTEAVMAAIRLARAATGKDCLLKFTGCYHGHTDAVLMEAGSGMTGQAASAGISNAVSRETLVAELDDIDALNEIFNTKANDLAAVIVEPLPANHGLLPQRADYLRAIRKLCDTHGVLLIFDEVISGFRIGFGGCAELYGIEPDLVTWGKIIGGGFPVGAYAGRKKLMQQVAPAGGVYQAGTLSANPVAMRAGLATLRVLHDGQAYARLETLGAELDDVVNGIDSLTVVRQGSVFWPCLTHEDGEWRRPATIPKSHAESFRKYFDGLLANNIYVAPSPWEVSFLSTAHTAEDVQSYAAALKTSISTN